MNTLNSVILAMQSQVVFNNRQAMCVEVKASFLSRFLRVYVVGAKKKLLQKRSLMDVEEQPNGKICHSEGPE